MATKAKPKADLHPQLHVWHYLSAVVFASLAVAAGIFMQPATYSLVVGHVTKNELLSQTNTVFAPAIHTVMDIQLRWVLVAILGLSALFSLFTVTRWHDRYHRELKEGVRPLRWLDLGITGGLMVQVSGLLLGIQDVWVLKTMAILVGLSCFLSWLSEHQFKLFNRVIRSVFGSVIVAAALPWLVIKASVIGTWLWGLIRLPWYVYAAESTLFVGGGLMLLNQWKSYSGSGKWKDYFFTERNYLVLNFVLKTAFAGILIIGLRK